MHSFRHCEKYTVLFYTSLTVTHHRRQLIGILFFVILHPDEETALRYIVTDHLLPGHADKGAGQNIVPGADN